MGVPIAGYLSENRGLSPITIISPLRGTRSMLRNEQWHPRRGELTVVIGAPLLPSGNDWQAALQLRDSVRKEILARLGEPDAAA